MNSYAQHPVWQYGGRRIVNALFSKIAKLFLVCNVQAVQVPSIHFTGIKTEMEITFDEAIYNHYYGLSDARKEFVTKRK